MFDSANIYSFDLANNLQGGANGWTYNTSNQATAAGFRSGAPSLSGGTGLSYDASGNLASMNGSTLGWDCWGHLASVSGSPSVSYTYNSAGQRVSKTVGGVTTFFLYAGDTLYAELDSNGNITQSYNWGPLGLISDASSTGSRFYLFDGLGNTRFLVSSAGAVLSDGAYTAWGASNNASYPSTPFCWKGQGGVYVARQPETTFKTTWAKIAEHWDTVYEPFVCLNVVNDNPQCFFFIHPEEIAIWGCTQAFAREQMIQSRTSVETANDLTQTVHRLFERRSINARHFVKLYMAQCS